MRTRVVWAAAALAALAAVAVGAEGASLAARGAGYALALASLVVLTGWSGQLNLHVAAIGLGWGAYAAAGLAAAGVPPLAAIVLAPLAVVPAALVIGAVAVRFRGLELAIATLAAGLAFEQTVFQSLGKWLGHTSGGSAFESSLVTIARPAGFGGDRAYALFAIALAAVWLAVAARAGRGAPGRTLRAIRDREVVAEARGVAVFGWRLGAFVLSIAVASMGGALLAGQTGAVTPDAFGLSLSLELLAVVMLAGSRRLDAAAIGAVLLLVSQEAGSIPVVRSFAGDRSDVVFGVGLIAAIAWRTARTRSRAVAPVTDGEVVPVAPATRAMPGYRPTVLRVEDVAVSFGSVRALEGVSLRVGRGEVCALVGGNGAGKTTLFNCITGLVVPERGAVYLDGVDITQMPPHRRARRGLARTFQTVELFDGLTVEEGVLLAAGVRASHGSTEAARAALAEVGIAGLADAAPASLPFASLRLVEIATALVSDPALVLLDEPLAGLDGNERARVLAAIDRLRAQQRGVLLVEHDRASVEAVADRVYGLVNGVVSARAPRPVRSPGRTPRRRKEPAVAAR